MDILLAFVIVLVFLLLGTLVVVYILATKPLTASTSSVPVSRRSSRLSVLESDLELGEEELLTILEEMEKLVVHEKWELLKNYGELLKQSSEWECNVNFTFEALDTDGSGKLDPYELQRLTSMTETEVQGLLDRFDHNGDGHIDTGEFSTLVEDESNKNIPWIRRFKASRDWVTKFIEEKLTGKIPAPKERRPLMFCAYGPQGSGKSSSTNSYLKSLNLDPVEISIDEITRRYAKDVLEDDEICNKSEGYFKVRKGWPTYARTELMNRCAELRIDMLFETTGRTMSTWKYRAKPFINGPENYRAVVIYVLVPYVELVKRVLSRYMETGQAYAGARELLQQVKDAAENSTKWFDTPEDGGFVYFDNNRGYGKQKRIESKMELQRNLKDYPFLKVLRETVTWRGISDDVVMSNNTTVVVTVDKRSIDKRFLNEAVE